MKTSSWNTRGLGNPQAIHNFCDLIKREALDVLFLQETRLSVLEAEKCKFKLGYPNCLVVCANGRKGGIALYWGGNVVLSIVNYSSFHIDAVVSDDRVIGEKWFLMAVYRFPETHLRYRAWVLLRGL